MMSGESISGWWLTRIRLHEWGIFDDCEFPIPLGCGLHLGGDSGTGKRTILDAILWAIVGDGNLWLNAGVSLKDRRSLRKYTRCYLDVERRYLRDAGIAHVLLEFTHVSDRSVITIGSVAAYNRHNAQAKTAFVIVDCPATPELLMQRSESGWEHLSIAALRKRAQECCKQGVRFEMVRTAVEYRDLLSQRMGDLPTHYFGALCHLMNRDCAGVDLDVLVREMLFGSTPVQLQLCDDQIATCGDSEAWHEEVDHMLRDFLTEVSRCHDKIISAVEEVNRAVLTIGFGPWRCRFAVSPVGGRRWPLMKDLFEALGAWRQHQGDTRGTWRAFARKHREVLDRLLEALTKDISELRGKEREQFVAPKIPSRHFVCEMQVRPEGSEWVNAACMIGWMRDEERQMLVQAVLVAAMLWAYDNHPNHPRLVLIPTAFTKIPDVLASILKVMRELGLQPIVAAPVGAFEVEQAMDYTLRLYRDPDDPMRRRYIQKRRLLYGEGKE
jgi:hypothetical protein